MNNHAAVETEALVCAYLFGEQGPQAMTWADISNENDTGDSIWIHLDRKHPDSRDWLMQGSGLDALSCEALLAEETRPRVIIYPNALLLILRGVNLNPGANPEDMVSLRVWVEQNRIITLRGPRILAVQDIRSSIAERGTPNTPAALLTEIVQGMSMRVGPVIDELEDRLDGLEEALLEATPPSARRALGVLRREAVALRRHLAPQREVLSRLSHESVAWLTAAQRARIREVADRTLRYVEDLDAIRERAAVTQEELLARQQDRMNRNMYMLSLVAAVFLPLGFVTGLLGINVGGMPGTDSASAFYIVCISLTVIAAIEITWLYLRRWL